MFEDYIQDAYEFYQLGKATSDDRKAKMYYRASVFCAASSLESFVNFFGSTFKEGNTLDKNEIAFLNDIVLEVTPQAVIKEKTKFYAIEHKIKFIIAKFNVPIDTASDSRWDDFNKFKELRNSLIHSKSMDDEKEINEYKESIKKGINANIDIMNTISTKVFSKPIRRSLTDLKI